jgi:hypothetical protein
MFRYKLSAPNLFQVIDFLTVLANYQWIEVLYIQKVMLQNGAFKYYTVEFNTLIIVEQCMLPVKLIYEHVNLDSTCMVAKLRAL